MLDAILRNALDTLEKNKQAQNYASDIKKFNVNMNQVLQSIHTINSKLEAAEAAQKYKLIDNPVRQEDRLNAVALLGEIYNQIHQGYLDSSIVGNLTLLASTLTNNLNFMWSSSIRMKTEQVISLLETFAPYIEAGSNHQALVQQLRASTEKLPNSADGVESFALRLEKAKKLVNKIGVNNEIQAFVRKVQNNRATLDDVTPEVISWLKEHNLIGRTRIKIV